MGFVFCRRRKAPSSVDQICAASAEKAEYARPSAAPANSEMASTVAPWSAWRSSRPPSAHACRARVETGIAGTAAAKFPLQSSKSSSNSGRMVKTVGPAATMRPPTGTWRILPPTLASFSITVTDSPRAASRAAAARPPIPAPMITTSTVFIWFLRAPRTSS